MTRGGISVAVDKERQAEHLTGVLQLILEPARRPSSGGGGNAPTAEQRGVEAGRPRVPRLSRLDALFALLLAAAVLACGIGLLTALNGGRGLGAFAVVTAAAAATNGLALALGGFSDTAMVATTFSGLLGLLFRLFALVWSWRRAVIRHP